MVFLTFLLLASPDRLGLRLYQLLTLISSRTRDTTYKRPANWTPTGPYRRWAGKARRTGMIGL